MSKFRVSISSNKEVIVSILAENETELDKLLAPEGFIITYKLAEKLEALKEHVDITLGGKKEELKEENTITVNGKPETEVKTLENHTVVEQKDKLPKCPSCNRFALAGIKGNGAKVIKSAKQIVWMRANKGVEFEIGDKFRECINCKTVVRE